ncbi:thrombospondin-type laminin G domain and EAR repeat-containing protein-like [Sinocyclocheilus grahami]|uniref:thrombospondin-type laminin G domain and EAR repeat-containing protein-like n=1 Tax=Sinocyclocheilus grahami TaxID=75366 RepID=UPI0007ACF45C|nr:PREDICTED: thrombospondin-type laminin G domain and EAR repeat-containing protein-like [Sinocyclocheilus grahami]
MHHVLAVFQRNEYLFAVVKEGANQLLLGLRFSKEKVHLIYQGSMGRERLSFKRIHLADNRWHSMVLAVSGHHATLTLDCGVPLELVHKQPFPSDLSTDGSRFHIGSRRKWKGLFSGLLRQLVLLPGSDATSRVCPSSKPSLAELSVPTFLSNLPVKSQMNDVLLPPYETEVRVTLGSKPACTAAELGQLWFDTLKRGLFLCDGAYWHSMLQGRKLKIILNGTFGATDWEMFQIGNRVFLAVANGHMLCERGPSLYTINSTIYELDMTTKMFLKFQDIVTYSAVDWEFFSVGDEHFLVVANSYDGSSYSLNSVIYR